MSPSLRPRTATVSDVPAVVPLLNAAYGANPTFEARFRTYLSLEPEGWVVVEDGARLVGVGGSVSFGRCAYLGLMAVAPEAQRRGIGAAVFEEILARCAASGRSLLLLDASDAGAPLYAKYDFRDRGPSLSYLIAPRASRAEREGDDGVRVERIDPRDPGIVDEIAAFDARCYGADRSRLLRRMMRELEGQAFAARDLAGEIAGYAVAQARSFGPCMARSAEVARALAGRALALPSEAPVRWLIAGQNREAVALAQALGGVPDRTWRHMRKGDEAELGSDWSTLFAKVSLAVG